MSVSDADRMIVPARPPARQALPVAEAFDGRQKRKNHEGKVFDSFACAQTGIDGGAQTRTCVCDKQEKSEIQGEARLMALPKYKTSRANTHSRRAQWKARGAQLVSVRTPEGDEVQVPQHLAAAVRKGYLTL